MNSLNVNLKRIVESLKLYINQMFKDSIGEGTLETSNKTIIGAINELNKRSGSSIVDSFRITSFNISPSMAQKGSSVNVTLSWNYNKEISSQTINGATLSSSLRQTTYSNVNSNSTYTLIGKSGEDTSTQSVSINFCNGIYYGKSSSTTYNSDFINSFTKILSDSKEHTVTVNAGIGEYIYYCLPTRLGVPQFTVGGFSGGFNKVSSISFTNSSGYSESYDIYKSTNANLGNTTIVVK